MQRKNLTKLLLLLVVLVLALSACSSYETTPEVEETAPAGGEVSAPSDDKISIAYINKMGDNPWMCSLTPIWL